MPENNGKKASGKKAIGVAIELEFDECNVRYSERAGTAARVEFDDVDGNPLAKRTRSTRDGKALLIQCARHGVAVSCNDDGVFTLANVG